jgi:hypothetical protein
MNISVREVILQSFKSLLIFYFQFKKYYDSVLNFTTVKWKNSYNIVTDKSNVDCGMLSYFFFAKIFIKIKILNQICYIIYLNNKFLLDKGERINESSSYGGI